MVDEVKIPTAEEILNPQGATEEQVAAPTTPQVSEDEERAMESGWVPKDQWKGDPEAWRPAKEFNERGELFNRIKQQSKDISELRNAMSFLTNQQRKQYFQGFNDAIAQLKQRRDAALEEGDLVSAQRINDKIDEHKEVLREQKQQVNTVPVAPQPTQTFFSWAEKNPWYTKDRKMTHYADAVGLAYKEENPDASEADLLRFVSREVRESFPGKFTQPKSPPSPDGDGRGATRGSTARSGSSSEESMPSDHREMMKTILKTTGMTKEEYLKVYHGS
jgi:hypothetical protein